MVILSVSICNRKGKILLARQYVPMSRLRIEGLLAAFPKLIDADEGSRSKQHTFIETTEVRYIYQPLDTLYLLLVTNMQSNILSDLSTLRMIAKLIPEYCGGHDEETVSNHAFNLLYALDEVVTPMGYKEPCSYNQISDFVKMDSAEEKLHEIIQKSKQASAQEIMKKKEKEFQEKRNQERKERGMGPRGPLGFSGIASSFRGGSDNVTSISSDQYNVQHGNDNNEGQVRIEQHGGKSGNKGKFGGGNDSDDEYRSKKKKPKSKGLGMKLGGSKKKSKLFEEAAAHDRESLTSGFEHLLKSTNDGGDDFVDAADLSPIEITISEKLLVTMDRDGVMKKFEVKGDMEVLVNDPDSTQCIIETNVNPSRKLDFGKPAWRLHPRMNSSEWKKGVLCLKDLQKKFRVGRGGKTSILKWRMSTTDEDRLPLTLEFWPEQESGSVTVNAQFTANAALKNAIITFPTPTNQEPEIASCEHGDTAFYRNDQELQWILNDLEEGDSGSIEYMVEDVDAEDLYPISIHFELEATFSQIEVNKVRDIDDEQTFEHSIRNSCVADKYIME